MYLVDRTAPQRLADAFPALYRFLLNKWYFDELYDLIFVRPAFAIGRLFWKGGDGAVIDGFGPDGVSARVLDVTRERRAAADGLRLSLRLRDAARRRRARHLVSVRGDDAMNGSWILSGTAGRCRWSARCSSLLLRGEARRPSETRAGSRCLRRSSRSR